MTDNNVNYPWVQAQDLARAVRRLSEVWHGPETDVEASATFALWKALERWDAKMEAINAR